jgi:hypothetical protein
MKQTIVASILGVWLLFEMKDFFINGGFSNSLAFGLLRICLVMVLLALLLMTNLLLNVLPKLFKSIIKNEKSELDERILELARLNQLSNCKPSTNNIESPQGTSTPRRSITPVKLDLNTARHNFKSSMRKSI